MTQTIDWPKVLGDLQWLLGEPAPVNPALRTPVGTRTLAKFLNVPRTTIVRYLEGAEPRHDAGTDLITAWCLLSGKSAEFVPRTQRTLSAAKMR